MPKDTPITIGRQEIKSEISERVKKSLITQIMSDYTDLKYTENKEESM
jgi:hypothetical protein